MALLLRLKINVFHEKMLIGLNMNAQVLGEDALLTSVVYFLAGAS